MKSTSANSTSTWRADALLLIAAVIWGSGFVAQRLGMEHVGPMTFNGVRFAIGTLVLLPVVLARRSRQGSEPVPRTRLVYAWGGLLSGGVLFAGASFQQIGLVYTTAGKAGFITGLYVVFVPILGLLLRQRPGWQTWAGAVTAAGGLYLLSVAGQVEINPGDLYVLACAVVWAVHVLLIGWLAPRTDPLKLATVQFAVCAVFALVAAAATEPITVEGLFAARWAILYSGVFSVGIAFTLQVVGQRDAPPAHAAILLSLEAVFAAIAGGVLLAERLSSRQLVGCALMLAGMLVSELRSHDRRSS